MDLNEMASLLNDVSRVAVWAVERDDESLKRSSIAMITSFQKSFHDAWVPKLHSHADFEDRALFRFFTELLPAFAAISPQLMDEHQLMDAHEHDIVDNAASLMLDCRSLMQPVHEAKTHAAALLEAFTAYHTLIIEHLAHEEQMLLGPWLSLSDDEYMRYQTQFLNQTEHGTSSNETQVLAAAAAAAVLPRATAAPPQPRATAAPKGKPSTAAPPPSASTVTAFPVLYDRRGRAVNMQTPGCCFDGVDSCCKGSAYDRLIKKWQREQHSA